MRHLTFIQYSVLLHAAVCSSGNGGSAVEALMKNWLLVNAKIRSYRKKGKSWKAFFRKKGRAKKKKTPWAIQAPSSSPPQLLSFRFRACCNKRWQRLLCLCWTIIPPHFIASRLRVALLLLLVAALCSNLEKDRKRHTCEKSDFNLVLVQILYVAIECDFFCPHFLLEKWWTKNASWRKVLPCLRKSFKSEKKKHHN